MKKEHKDTTDSVTKKERTKKFIEEKRTVIKTKGIYLLPSLFTVANIFCGFYAIVLICSHLNDSSPARYFFMAAILIMISSFFDGIDGKVAKLTNSTSDFGVQLDSIADVISFGVAPGLLVYGWALHPWGRMGWLPAFLFLICGALRLARFNVQSARGESDKHFKGLPIPFGALMIATTVLITPSVPERGILSIVIMVGTYGLSYLMISTIPYRSFKEIDLREKKSAKVIFFIALFFVIIFIEPPIMLFLIVLTYVLSGPINKIFPTEWTIDETLHRDILVPPEEFDDIEVSDEGVSKSNTAEEE